MKACVIGGGFAGCECAWQIAMHGIDVTLYEMKPSVFSPAHSSENLCEVVCSNSFKASAKDTAAGLLKAEMRLMGSLSLMCADKTSVPAGGALAVDRTKFSKSMTEAMNREPHITVKRVEIVSLDDVEDCDALVIATGPLTSDTLSHDIQSRFGLEKLSFYDAAAPIVLKESIDMTKAFYAARYGKGEGVYINCPMNRDEYMLFYEELINAETAHINDFDESCLYEGCMPIESMAKRGSDTIRFGPLKPVGLDDPVTGEKYYAVTQLRQDDTKGSLYNMVGFQTRLKFPEQKRVFGMIPALKDAEYVRYGVMHRNTYIRSPEMLSASYSIKDKPSIFFAGQITGVEGYMESASSGILAGINVSRFLKGEDMLILPTSTMTGALANYISGYKGKDFQPMGANFGILENDLECRYGRIRDKAKKRGLISEESLCILNKIKF